MNAKTLLLIVLAALVPHAERAHPQSVPTCNGVSVTVRSENATDSIEDARVFVLSASGEEVVSRRTNRYGMRVYRVWRTT
jgi:hypothetical protein